MGALILVEKGYTKEDALRTGAMVPAVAGGLVGARAVNDAAAGLRLRRYARSARRDADLRDSWASRLSTVQGKRNAMSAARRARASAEDMSRVGRASLRSAAGRGALAAGLVTAGAAMTVPTHRKRKDTVGKSLVELSKSAKAGWKAE